MNQFAEGSPLLIEITDVVDAAGNPAALDATPVWTTSDSTILALKPDSDGMSASGTVTKTGTVTVTASSGSISASVAITVIAGAAVSFHLSVTLADTPPAPPTGPPSV